MAINGTGGGVSGPGGVGGPGGSGPVNSGQVEALNKIAATMNKKIQVPPEAAALQTAAAAAKM